MDRIHVGIITEEYPPTVGGLGISVRRISQSLSQLSYLDISILHLDSSVYSDSIEKQVFSYEDGKVKIYRIHPLKIKEIENSANVNLGYYENIKNIVISQKINLLHSFYVSHTGVISCLLAKEMGIPVICSFRGNDIHKDIFNQNYFSKILWVLENSDYCTFVSHQAFKRAMHLCNSFNQSRGEVIWNGINPSDYDSPMKSLTPLYNLPKPVICSSGYFRRTKGTDILLTAFTKMRKGSLLLIGDFKPDELIYFNNIIQHEEIKKNNIILTGYVEHRRILKYLDLAEIAVFPSRYDGCSNSVIEAMLSGKPIICSREGAIAEIIQKSQGGIVLDKCDPESIVDAITNLLTNGLIKKMGKENKEFVLKCLTSEIEVDRWCHCYKRVLQLDNDK